MASFSKKVESIISNTKLVSSLEEMQKPLHFLSEFYTTNTVESRKNLRDLLEEKAINSFEEMENKLSHVYQNFQDVKRSLGNLNDGFKIIENYQKQHEDITKKFTEKVQTITTELKQKENLLVEYEDFLQKYQLSNEERQILVQRNIDSEDFFIALNKVYDIQQECRKKLLTHHHNSLLEVMSEMSIYQNAAYDRLSRWIQEKCHHSDSYFEENLRMAINTLTSRPILLKSCINEIIEARRNFIRKEFLENVQLDRYKQTIDVKNRDNIRFISDFLAWIHQHAATEKETIGFLFHYNEETKIEKNEEEIKKKEKEREDTIESMINKIFDVLIDPVKNFIEESFFENENNDQYLKELLKLSNLIEFYVESLKKFLGEKEKSKMIKTLEEVREKSLKIFDSSMKENEANEKKEEIKESEEKQENEKKEKEEEFDENKPN